jgi:hypothetical protein
MTMRNDFRPLVLNMNFWRPTLLHESDARHKETPRALAASHVWSGKVCRRGVRDGFALSQHWKTGDLIRFRKCGDCHSHHLHKHTPANC